MENFWTKLNKPIFALAPMEEVTDVAFREMFATVAKPDVMFTEFVNIDGLLNPVGFTKLSVDLAFSPEQRPIVAQLWGTDPAKFFQAARLVKTLGFDGVDINMGCPQDKEISIGACAALIKNPKLAGEIIAAAKEGSMDLPVSVKTRLGYTKTSEMAEWLKALIDFEPAAITIHARTKQEKSKVPAHWEKITEAVKLRNELNSKTLILGNGDIRTRAEGQKRIEETNCDGVMIGRGAFGNPWLFSKVDHTPDLKERFEVMIKHAELFDEKLGGQKSFFIMRKHFKAYASGFDGAAELRALLLNTKNLSEVKSIVENFLRQTELQQAAVI